MIRVLAVLIMTVALVGCKKEDVAPVTENSARGFELKADADFDRVAVYPNKASLIGTWDRTGIQWVAGTHGGPDFLQGVYKGADNLPYKERWTFTESTFTISMFNVVSESWNVFRTGNWTPGNTNNVFYVTNRAPDTEFLQSKFIIVSNTGIELKVRMKTQRPNKLRARTWLKKVN